MSAMSRSLFSRLCFLPLFTRPAAPRLANQAINLPVEANRPQVVNLYYTYFEPGLHMVVIVDRLGCQMKRTDNFAAMRIS
jgi:hypothetical protein